MVTIPGKSNTYQREVGSKRDFSFLQRHILHKRKIRESRELVENCIKTESSVNRPFSSCSSSHGSESDQKSLSDKSDQGDKPKEPEKETPADISKQIKDLKIKLESLREKKHTLFQQLKAVLHEEDERKRLREEEHKEALEKNIAEITDPRLSQVSVGMKRSLPSSPPVLPQGSQNTPAKKTHRVPLLPTPDPTSGASSVTPFIRQGSGGSFHSPVSEAYHGPIRQHYGGHGPFQAGHRSHVDQRFGMTGQMPPQELHQGMPLVNYQYAPAPGPIPYNTVANIPQSSQMSYQPVVQQGYMQPHLHEMPMQGQPPPHMFNRPHPQPDMKWHQAPPHYIPQSGQLPGQLYPDPQHPGTGYATHVQDPRHQKIVHDHQRSSSALNSPISLQSPPIQESQSNSPAQSPGHNPARDRMKI